MDQRDACGLEDSITRPCVEFRLGGSFISLHSKLTEEG